MWLLLLGCWFDVTAGDPYVEAQKFRIELSCDTSPPVLLLHGRGAFHTLCVSYDPPVYPAGCEDVGGVQDTAWQPVVVEIDVSQGDPCVEGVVGVGSVWVEGRRAYVSTFVPEGLEEAP